MHHQGKWIDYFDILSNVNIESALALQTRARLTDRRVFHATG